MSWVILPILLVTTSCMKKYTCNCTSYKKGTKEIAQKQDIGFRGKLTDGNWDQMCASSAHNIDSINYYSTETECVTY